MTFFNFKKLTFLSPAFIIIVLASASLSGCSSSSSLSGKAVFSDEQSGKNKPVIKEVPITKGNVYHLYTSAQLLEQSGDIDGAIKSYKMAIAIDPNSPVLLTDLARLYLKKNSPYIAIDLLTNALDSDETYINAQLLLARVYDVMNQLEKAAVEYEKTIALNTSDTTPYLKLANVYTKLKEYDKAIAVMKQFQELDSESLIGKITIARLYSEMGKVNQAINIFEATLKENNTLSIIYKELGKLYEEKKMTDEAIKVYEQAIKNIPDDASFRNTLAGLYIKEKRLDDAKKVLNELKAHSGSTFSASIRVGLIYMEQELYKEAIVEFEQLVSDFPDEDKAVYYLAVAHKENGNLDKAEAQLKNIQKESEIYADSAIQLALMYEEEKRHDDAIAILKTLVTKKNLQNNMEIYRLIISVYKETDRLKEAVEFIESQVKSNNTNTELLYLLGTLYYEVGENDKSLASMERVLEVEPDHANALNHYGYTLAERGIRLDEAEFFIKKALELEPESGHIIDSLGWLYFQKGEVDKAVTELERAYGVLPEDPTVAEHLGDAYLKQSAKKKALEFYKKAGEFDPENSAIKDKIQNLEREIKN